MHKPCAVIPVYNHETAVPAVVEALLARGLPCVLVDDASSPQCAAVLEQLAGLDQVFLIRLAINQGKGGAVMAGLREAAQLGFSHARKSMPMASTTSRMWITSSSTPRHTPRRWSAVIHSTTPACPRGACMPAT